MVRKNIIRITALLVISAQLSACGFVHNVWGEKAEPRKTVTVVANQMPPIENIFSDDDALAMSTLAQYKTSILNSFDQIKGHEKDRLSMEEVESLTRSGLAKLSDDTEISVLRVHSALSLLGFKTGVTRDQVITLLDWVATHRTQGKSFYEVLFKSDTHQLTSGSLIQLVQFVGSLIELGGGNALTTTEVSDLIQPWISSNYVHLKKAIPSSIDLLISAFSSLCGDRVDPVLWNAQKNGTCLRDLMDHFQSTAPVFDFIFDRLNPITDQGTLITANSTLVDKVASWMKDHHHPAFPTQRVADLAIQLDIPTPYNFFQLTEWIPKLNSDSTAKMFSPLFFIDVARLIQNWVTTFTTVTAGTKETDACNFSEWRKCKFQGTYDTAERLFNDEYATLVRHDNLDFIYKISFYDSVGDYLIKAFDTNGDGLLQDDIKDLISIVVRILDSNAFAQNVILRIQEKPVDLINTEDALKAIHRQGLSEVAAIAADLIPDRGGNKRTLLKKITATVYDADKHPGYTLDRLGITSFIYVFDLLGNLKQQYMRDYDYSAVTEGSITWIKRRKVVENLPRLLHDHFPRIYNECLDWGFERTCGVVYTEVLASAAAGTDTLQPSDLDIISLTSILLESMMNRCDRNHDDVLSTNIMDGFDEKSCALTVSTTLATRLMNANILANDQTTKTLLGVLKWVAPARWIAKVALEKGTLHGLGLRVVPFISLVSKPAHLGGMMSLTAEFMDPDKVKAIEAGVMGHHEDIGDELIYLNQLTEKYLPSHSWALRTSAAARILYGPSMVTHP